MRLGFYTNYSEEVARFAQDVGFTSLELSAWPSSTLNADTVENARVDEIRRDLDSRGIEISALGYYPNYLDPDPDEAAQARRYFLKLLDLAVKMNVPVVSTFAGRIPDRPVADSIEPFRELFARFVDEAERRGLRIAIENCPMTDRLTLQGTNIAFSPEVWDAMFEAVPSKSLGLELDPSHMVWLGIDYIQAIYDYGDRIFHIHAKDTEVIKSKLSRVGIYGQAFGSVGFGHGWWRFRTPGWGDVDWPRLVSALIDVNYQGNLDIEHEDEVFAQAAAASSSIGEEADIVATYGRETAGLVLGFRHLSNLIPPPGAIELLPIY